MDSRRKARENFGFLKVFGQDPVTDLGSPYRQGGGVGGVGVRILGSLTKSQVSLGLVDLCSQIKVKRFFVCGVPKLIISSTNSGRRKKWCP